jgi:hypothetical protein
MSGNLDPNVLIDLDIEEILATIGEFLNGRGATSPSRESLIDAAMNWLRRRQDALCDIICKDETVYNIVNSDNSASRRLELITRIGDIIATKTIGVPVVLVSVLLVKEGLRTTCKKYWAGVS